MASMLDDEGWEILLQRIEDGRCTPFLGAGACHGAIPLGAELAERWADKFSYPLKNRTDLAAVAQFVAVKYDASYPKELLRKEFAPIPDPNYTAPDQPHGVLADLPLPLYITTNYDDFMFRALEQRQKRPVRELCRWNKRVKYEKSVFDGRRDYQPTPETPLVYHLHGHITTAASLVLTEDDYLDFLVNISEDDRLLPSRVQKAMADTSLLFLGYSIADWDFRVLFRSIAKMVERSVSQAHVSVQLEPVTRDAGEDERKKVREYLDRYFSDQKIRVFWGTARDFVQQLRAKWDAHPRTQYYRADQIARL